MSFILVGCKLEDDSGLNSRVDEEAGIAEQDNLLTGSFMLQADPAYISADNETDASVYIIDSENNEVYVTRQGKAFTAEELEMIDEMSPEEFAEFIGDEVYEEPLYEISALKATRDEIVLDYEEEQIIFTALSKSYFESDSGIRYQLHENTSIAAYKASLYSE